MKKYILGILGILAIPFAVHAGDITSTGMSQGDLVQFLDNTKSLVNDLAMRAKNQCLNSAGLNASGTQTKTSTTESTYCVVDGAMVVIGSSTKITGALGTTAVGSTTGSCQIYIITADSSGVLTSTEGTPSNATATVTLPNIPEKQAMLGFLWLYGTGATAFLPGTHAVTAGTISVAYVNTQGMVDFIPGTGSTNSLSLTGL